FSCGLVQASLVTSSGLLPRAWNFITSLDEPIVSQVGNGLFWKVLHGEPDLTVVTFEVKPDFDLKPGLISSSHLKENNFCHFEFLCTKKIPVFSVNSSAVSLFYENREKLDELKCKINGSPRLIVTGHGLGGPIASLFTLSLLDSTGLGKKRPLCITFGSPLVGDKKLQEAISRNPTWSSCFLHVVSYKDPLPKRLKPHTSAYMPFGTFLFCSEIYTTCFENPESVLELLVSSIHDQNQVEPIDYGEIVGNLYRQATCKDTTARAQNWTHCNSMHVSISLQLAALGLTPDLQQQQQKNFDFNTLVTKMETLENKFIYQKRVKFDPSKKLNVMKIDMAQLEWYKKDSKIRKIGYYDSYKENCSTSDQDVSKYQKSLTNYWKDMVEEGEMKPQTEGAAFRTRWLYGGTNYRRMVEPLDIAEYYKNGGKDYVQNQRSRHYKVLEEWLEEEKKDTSDSNSSSRKNVELILTIDSCFWAHVEEALLLCKQLQNVQSSVTEKEATKKLLEFEEYVYGLLKRYQVSPEIFLEKSSYMKWWNQYKGISGKPELATFMSDRHHYDQYTEGNYINSCTQLIVTRLGLGGSIASLLAISLLDSIGSGKNSPHCITYGSPLIGDKKLQQAISYSPIWNSCFLHVVSLEDPLKQNWFHLKTLLKWDDSVSTYNTTRDAEINLSLPGDAFDLVVRAKTALELACPNTVSCADILSAATRDLLTMLGGPFYPVFLGRRDGRSSLASAVPNHLPTPSMPIPQILQLFTQRGFSVEEFVALSGAHTVGFSHCSQFASNIYNTSSSSSEYNPRFSQGLQKACADYKTNPTLSVFNDIMTPNKFDNVYFQNLPKGLGVLKSDHGLYSDPLTRPFVETFAKDQTRFFQVFAKAMQKLSLLGVQTGRKGEIRRRCDQIN
ncbi:Peroxidase 63, partial [Mucuna pruriens]